MSRGHGARDGKYTINPEKIETPAGSAPPHAPMPNREVPRVIFECHEIHPYFDVDWTIPTDKHDVDKEKRLRQDRNEMIKEGLLEGKLVQYKSSGWSLYPIVWSGDTCVFEPMRDGMCKTLKMNWDIVFCQVQPSERYFAHKVIRFEYEQTAASAPGSEEFQGKWYTKKYWIGNNKGHINGWCHEEHIYGRLVETVYFE